jgi:prepilin-type N-terminal cleavage/methylation domain-containing protein
MEEERYVLMKNRKGFTLAELLIVVAIIAVLVAISIPIFSRQLEKARDAASVANLRSAYSEAMSYAIQYNGTLTGTSMTPEDNPNITLYGGPKYGGNVTAVIIKGIYLHSSSANDWSGTADNLPFYNMMTTQNMKGSKWIFDSENHGDTGNYDGYYRVEFYLWSGDLSGDLHGVYIIQQKYDAKGNIAA